jgi:hypothetical protein
MFLVSWRPGHILCPRQNLIPGEVINVTFLKLRSVEPAQQHIRRQPALRAAGDDQLRVSEGMDNPTRVRHLPMNILRAIALVILGCPVVRKGIRIVFLFS